MTLYDIRQRLLIYFVVIPYLKPYDVTLDSRLDNFFKIWKVIATLFVIFLFIGKKEKFSTQGIIISTFMCVWGISIYTHCGTLGDNLQEILSILGIVIATELIKNSKRIIDNVFIALYNISTIYIILQLITVISGTSLSGTPIVGRIYFLGGDNRSAFIILPLCAIMLARDYRSFNRIRIKTLILAIMGWLCFLLVFSVAGMIAYGIFLLFMMNMNKKAIQKKFPPKKLLHYLLGIMVIFLVGVIFFDIQRKFQVLLDVLGKTGLSSREIIWKDAFKVFLNNWLIGIGNLTNEEMMAYVLYGTEHAHNIILEVLMDTGIIGSILYIMWIKNIFNINTENESKCTLTLEYCFIACLACALFDFYLGLIFFYVLMLMLFISKREDKINVVTCNKK